MGDLIPVRGREVVQVDSDERLKVVNHGPAMVTCNGYELPPGAGHVTSETAVLEATPEARVFIEHLPLAGGTGTPGEPGPPGKSAFQVWLDAGNQGTVDDFFASLQGPSGSDGEDGADGAAGVDGAPGPVVPATSSAIGAVKITGTPTDAAAPQVRVRESSDATYAPTSHTHTRSQITDFAHTHSTGDVSGLDTQLANVPTPGQKNALAGTQGTPGVTNQFVTHQDARLSDARTPTAHSHPQGDVTGLASALSGKVDTSDARLTDARTPTAHTHAQSDVTGLVSALAGKAASSHSHAQADVTNLVTDLAGKAPASHTHTRSQITDFAHSHPVSELTATGTRDATTFLRGDNTWQVPPAGGGGGGPTFVKLTADHANFTGTGLANITGLSFPVTAGTLYTFEAKLIFRTPALTTGARFGLTCPAFTVLAGNVNIPFAADGSGGLFHGFLTSSGDSVVSSAVAAINTDYVATLTGTILPSANGTVQLQAATEVNASALTVRNGSFLSYLAV